MDNRFNPPPPIPKGLRGEGEVSLFRRRGGGFRFKRKPIPEGIETMKSITLTALTG
jgi:hypothetical protein